MALKLPKIAQKLPKIAEMAQKWPKMAQKLAPAEKNSTDISAGSATFCISGEQWNSGAVMGKLGNRTTRSWQLTQLSPHTFVKSFLLFILIVVLLLFIVVLLIFISVRISSSGCDLWSHCQGFDNFGWLAIFTWGLNKGENQHGKRKKQGFVHMVLYGQCLWWKH